ncbi:hypothetical protein [Sphingomonas adhaesiva]|uniref:hypothetical protein n=1 Tax=Sphingomonas adhaesiva TaxID=28212 RepID=UPI002FF99EE2
MNAPVSITAPLDAATLALVEELAAARGMSRDAFAAEAIRRVAESEADLAAFVRVGEEQIRRGDYVEHDTLLANLRRWRDSRVRPA